MSTSGEYMSFIVRLSRSVRYGSSEACAASQEWQGEVEHIQTGRSWTFRTLDELVDFLRRLGEDPRMLIPPEKGGGYEQ